jgi:hypothetical protein
MAKMTLEEANYSRENSWYVYLGGRFLGEVVMMAKDHWRCIYAWSFRGDRFPSKERAATYMVNVYRE